MRLFIALDLPETLRERLQLICCGLPGARWVPPEQYHLTLHFIGEVDGAELRNIRDCLATVESEPFSLQPEGIGFFPPRKKPHTLWVGVRQEEQLTCLHNRIGSALIGIGMELEKRKFAPHITLARLKNTPATGIGGYLQQHGLLTLPPFRVDNFRLYSSVLGSRGAKHYVEQEYLLGSAC
ncbi:MAG: RNA 2',3'-cyclic phosphodiesterase [Candidatus Electrothrix sp. YB6]